MYFLFDNLPMVIEKINVNDLVQEINEEIKIDNSLNSNWRGKIEKSLIVMKAMSDRLSKNSRNSSIPPSQDSDRDKESPKKRKKRKKRKPGGQPGHKGVTLEKVDNPTEIVNLEIDRRTLPRGEYEFVGHEARQVFDVDVSVIVTEYRAEIIEDRQGNQYVADFPEDVNKATQYGITTKSLSVYMSVFQLVPLDRLRGFFNDQLKLPISKGSISNFNKKAEDILNELNFAGWAKNNLLESKLLHADETGINVNAKKYWLHGLSNERVTLYHADNKRGVDAMDRMGILPDYKGVLCHDHWSSYYTYNCTHALCNAHHQRELEFAHEQDGQKWAVKMSSLLEEIRKMVKASSKGHLSDKKVEEITEEYRSILENGKKECPVPPRQPGQRGRQKKSKSRNLLERLINYEDDTLRFMKEAHVPYTNNQAEGDIRMAKIYQNVSKCFRNITGAKRFCLIRSYIITAKKHGMDATEALGLLFQRKVPFFMME